MSSIKNICDSWEKLKISTLTGVWKKSIPTLMDDFERFKTSVEEVIADVVKMARELELEVAPEDVTELLQSHDKTSTDEELLLTDEQRTWFLEMESTPGEDVVKMVEMTIKDSEYDINLVEKAVAGFESIDSNFKGSSVGKMLLNSTARYSEVIHERKSQSRQQTSLSSYFKKWPRPPQPSAAITLISQPKH